GPRRQLHASDDEPNGEATRKCAEQGCRLVRKRHRQHKADIQCAEEQTCDETKNNLGHNWWFIRNVAQFQRPTREISYGLPPRLNCKRRFLGIRISRRLMRQSYSLVR